MEYIPNELASRLVDGLRQQVAALEQEKAEHFAIMRATAAEKDELRAKAEAADARRAAAEYRAQRIVLDKELEAQVAALTVEQDQQYEFHRSLYNGMKGRAEAAESNFARLQQGLRVLHTDMATFATTKPGGQQVRTKSAREMVEHFAYEAAALLAAPIPPRSRR